MSVLKALIVLAMLAALAAGVLLWRVREEGFSARAEPTAVERAAARAMRDFAIPATMKTAANPVPLTPEVLDGARRHFADHCASCHGNDGQGDTAMGRNLYPKAPDMTAGSTQALSDGALFAIITNGVRLTGMPAWGDGSEESNRETWGLVHFIRHLPEMNEAEVESMKTMNPLSREEWEAMAEEEAFLSGGEPGDAEQTDSVQDHH